MDDVTKRPPVMMLDSGAFSAWTKGKRIDVPNYCRFIEANHERFRHYVNVDVIPGRPGHKATPHQAEEAAAAGWKNFRTMVKAGLEPVVVYHYGERRYWLEKMIGEGCRYIGLGGVARMSRAVRGPWLDSVFTFLWERGAGHVRTHGFGVTSADLVHRYPWYSVDSVTWKRFTAYGLVLMPRWEEHLKRWDYRDTPHQFFLQEMDGTKEVSVARFRVENLGPSQRGLVNRYLKDSGFTQKQVNTDRVVLDRLNARYFLRSAAAHTVRTFVPLRSLFGPAPKVPLRPVPWDRLRMFLAGDERDEALNLERSKHRLLSYYALAGKEAVVA